MDNLYRSTGPLVLYCSFCFALYIYPCVLGFGEESSALVVLSCMWFNLSRVNGELRLCVLFIAYIYVYIYLLTCPRLSRTRDALPFSISLLSFLLWENQSLFPWRLESNAKQSLLFYFILYHDHFFVYCFIVEELRPILSLLDNLNIFIFA